MIGRTLRSESNVFPKDCYRQQKEKENRCYRTSKKHNGKQSEENPPSTNSWAKRFDDRWVNSKIGVFEEGTQPCRCRCEKQ